MLDWDENTLVLTWSQSRNGKANSNGEVRYSLVDDGQTFIAEERMSSKRKAHHNIWVFLRSE